MRTRADEILARHRFLDPLLPGARVLELGAVLATGAESARALQDRGAASVVSVDRDPEALRRAAQEGGGPGLHFREAAGEGQADAAFDLVLVHDPSWLFDEPGLFALQRLLAPGGHLFLALAGGGPELGQLLGDEEALPEDPPSYERVSGLLAAAFASVEVAVQRAIVGYALSPVDQAAATLSVEELSTESETPGQILFLCGASASGLLQQKLVLSRLPPLIAAARDARFRAVERAEAAAEDEFAAKQAAWEQERAAAAKAEAAAKDELAAKEAAWEQERAAAVERAVAEAEARWDVERSALRALAAGQAPPRDESESDEALMRRVREAEERAEAARLHAKEAEARMRAAERRADAAEAERARSALAARRYRGELEALQRSTEGIAASIAGRR